MTPAETRYPQQTTNTRMETSKTSSPGQGPLTKIWQKALSRPNLVRRKIQVCQPLGNCNLKLKMIQNLELANSDRQLSTSTTSNGDAATVMKMPLVQEQLNLRTTGTLLHTARHFNTLISSTGSTASNNIGAGPIASLPTTPRLTLDAKLAIIEAAGGTAGILRIFMLTGHNLQRLGLSEKYQPYTTAAIGSSWYGQMVGSKIFKNSALIAADRESRDALLYHHAVSFREELPFGPPVLFNRTKDVIYLETLGDLTRFLVQAQLEDLRSKRVPRLALETGCFCHDSSCIWGHGRGFLENLNAMKGVCAAIRIFQHVKTIFLVLPSSMNQQHINDTKLFAEHRIAGFMDIQEAIWRVWEARSLKFPRWVAPEIVVTTKQQLMGLL